MNIMDFVENGKVVVTDGAMGTYLEHLSYKGQTPELAVIESPYLVKKIHTEYIEAGAQVILTDTFGGNRLRLSKKKIGEMIKEINSKAAEIASDVRKNYHDILVAGDIGPTGEILEPYGDLTKNDAEKVFVEQAEILQEGGVDFILLETFQDLEELKSAFYSIREKLNLFVLPCISLNPGVEFRTLMGQKIEDIVGFAEKEKTGVLGINCGIKSREMVKVVQNVRKITDVPLWIKPNAGVPELSGGKVIYPETKEEFTDNCIEMVNLGISFIGGCCGSTPEYIALLKAKLNENG